MTNRTDSELLDEYKMLCHLRAAVGDIPPTRHLQVGMTLDEVVARGAAFLLETGSDLVFADWVWLYDHLIIRILRKHYET